MTNYYSTGFNVYKFIVRCGDWYVNYDTLNDDESAAKGIILHNRI